MPDPIKQLHEALIKYFDALYFGDVELFRDLFHQKALLFCGTDSTSLTVEQYLDLVSNREPPAARDDPRQDHILSIEVPTPTTAHARVRELFLPKRFTDELTFVGVEGRWKIIAKVWHFDTIASD